MFLRALCRQCYPKLFYLRAGCFRRYLSDDGRKPMHESMDERAREFLDNLDNEQLKRKEEIEHLIEQCRYENHPIPNKITDRNWWELLQQVPARGSYLRCLHRLQVREEMKAQKKMKRLQSLDENEAMVDHLFHDSIKRDIQINMWKKLSAMMSEIPVIIDLDFDVPYQKEEVVIMHDITLALKHNAFHPQPLSFNITSCNNNLRLIDFQKPNHTFPGGYFHEQHYLDLFPSEQLVYLSPDAKPLEVFDTKCTYIVGGISNLDKIKYETVAKAKKQGIRSASFPIGSHGRLYMDKNLTIYKALQIVRSMYYLHSWNSVFTECFTPEQYKSDFLPRVTRRRHKNTRRM